jgi:hypothetical protein
MKFSILESSIWTLIVKNKGFIASLFTDNERPRKTIKDYKQIYKSPAAI